MKCHPRGEQRSGNGRTQDIAAARSLLDADVLTAQKVASRFSVSRSTLYRSIAEAKGLVLGRRLAEPAVLERLAG